MSWLLSGLLFIPGTQSIPTAPPRPAFVCQARPAEDRLPKVIAPMFGADPAWMVDGLRHWSGGDLPVKTIWVLKRTSQPVRIEGRRLDAPGRVTFRESSGPISDVLAIPDPARASVTPGGATPEVMRTYAFVMSEVFYPTPGCWEFPVHVGGKVARIVRDVKAQH
jgi:hypothetical protein